MDSKILFKINKFKHAPIFFTDRKRFSSENDFSKILERLPKRSLVIFREYDLPNNERKKMAIALKKTVTKRNISLLIGKNFEMAKEILACGIHFSDQDHLSMRLRSYMASRARNIRLGKRNNFLLTISCHSFSSLLKYQKFLPDRLFISPIFPTDSHAGATSFGALKLARIANKLCKKSSQTPNLCALGGINESNLRLIRKLNLSGFGAIDLFLKLQKSS